MKKNILTKMIFLCCIFLWSQFSIAQEMEQQLAEQYYIQEEYDKALSYYDAIAKDYPYLLDEIYAHYLTSYYKTKNFEGAEQLIQKQIKEHSEDPSYQIDYGFWQETQQKETKAKKTYEEVIEVVKKNPVAVEQAVRRFLKMDKLDWAEQTLLTARDASRQEAAYAGILGDVYFLQGKKTLMIEEYLGAAKAVPEELQTIKGFLQDRLSTPEDYQLLENTLIERIQSEPNEIIYNELLLWLYLQQKLFSQAFIQAKALDRRYKQQGTDMLSIGLIALNNEDYEASSLYFEYIIERYPKSNNYNLARQYYIKAKEEVVKNTFPIQEEEIRELITEYELLLEELGRNMGTIEAQRNVALLYAFYLNDRDKAIEILNQAIEISRSFQDYLDACKLDLADIYLLKGEPWESTLLYSQVEKDQEETNLGHQAKLKNAKLMFYEGDFELSQEFLDILKLATSREIANDAMDLSLLIRDNLVLDTTGNALQSYANIELLIFQNQVEQALTALNEISEEYNQHSLHDEILWQKANLLMKLSQFEDAIQALEEIVEKHGEDILADDAHFLIGKIYEEQLEDKQKAMEYYERHLLAYKGSIHVVEARKRFRILRGDFIE